MIKIEPVTLEGHGVRLEPLGHQHADDLALACQDGDQWRLFFTFVPEPAGVEGYIDTALAGKQAGHMLPWAVRDLESDQVIGSTRYHDMVLEVNRVEIGWTWYAQSYQRTHVNTACKLLLMEHAFERAGCGVVGFQCDVMNKRSQRAIEGIGARKDGVIRHISLRRDGSVRDTAMYSLLASEWAEVKKHLETRLWRGRV